MRRINEPWKTYWFKFFVVIIISLLISFGFWLSGKAQVIQKRTYPRQQLNKSQSPYEEVYKFYSNEIYLQDIMHPDSSSAWNGTNLRVMLALNRFDYLVVSDSFAIDYALLSNLSLFFYPSGHFHITDNILYSNCYFNAGPYKIHEAEDPITTNNCRYTYPYPEWFEGDTTKLESLFPNYYASGGGGVPPPSSDSTFSPYIYLDTGIPDSAAMVVHRVTPYSNQKTPTIDVIIETPSPVKGLNAQIRVFIKGNDTTTYVANLEFGMSDTQRDGKMWFSTYWSEPDRWYTSTFEKGFWWVDGGILLKPGIPYNINNNMLFVQPDGFLYHAKQVGDTVIPFKIVTEDMLQYFRAVPY